MTVRFIDLFAGIGGFHLASHNVGGETVFASEWDKFARLTYEHNFKALSPDLFANGMYAGDITKVDPNTIPDFDILAGGFPCQPFSGAGLKGGFSDTRGTLFFNVADIIKTKQPKAFFLENVRGLLTHDDGKTFNVIKNTLDQLGYTCHWKVLRGSDFNVPQHRPRLYIVGFRKDLDDTFEWPEPVKLTNTLDKILGGKVTTKSGADRKIGFTLRVGGRRSGVNDRRNWDTYIVDGNVHSLTLEEAKALQGFPDWYSFEKVSETQAFKQLGNAVVVPAVQATMESMLTVLDKN
jgi:DNA (cytosine-5)-methyltransferase 1